MPKPVFILPFFLVFIVPSVDAVEPLTSLSNGGFEDGLSNWKLGDNSSQLSTEQAASGTASLKVSATAEAATSLTSMRVPVTAGYYTLRGKIFPLLGRNLGITLRFLTADGKEASGDSSFSIAAPFAPVNAWKPFEVIGRASQSATFAEVEVRSYRGAKLSAYLDDFSLLPSQPSELLPPWSGTYKIKPAEKARLTAADVVGPDGIVYPDWRYAGKPGGIPNVKASAKIEDFGAKADDDLDDSQALEKGAADLGKRGGGALLLGPGVYMLDKPVIITWDNVVIRGMGANRTKLVFRYNKIGETPSFFSPAPGAVIDANSWVEAHVDPTDLQALEIQVDGKRVVRRDKGLYANATYSIGALGANILDKVDDKEGRHELKAIAEYSNGKTLETNAVFRTTAAAPQGQMRQTRELGAITFAGLSQPGAHVLLARDAVRGDKTLWLQNATGLKTGSRIALTAPATPRWNALVGNACKWGDYRRYEFLVTGVQGNQITLNQPLRLDYPTIDGSYIEEISPLRNCGVEDLTLEQTHRLWTSGIVFSNAWECWARGVTVKKAGRFPLYAVKAKWCEFRDCVVDDAWIKDNGGTAYVGWDYSYDCLLDGITTFNVRHAPLVQWSSSGNVIRRGVMHGSDAQWHAGWTNENLFEQCIIESRTGNGGYGYGMWDTPPEDADHGPNGPRNVVYNCDISSPLSGVSMGGMNENWLFVSNRFTVEKGPGITARTASFDHIFKDNVFVLKDATQPAFFLKTPDCIGWELMGNTIIGGNGQLYAGLGEPLITTNNKIMPSGDASRPLPQAPSIFEWQRQHLK